MADIKIDHKRSDPFTTCNGNDICQVELVNTNYSVKGKKEDKIKFQREGSEATAGFQVTIDPQFNSGAIFLSPNPILHVDIPAGQAEGDYKYTIAYPNDTTAIVAPLDPIIIIEGESGFNLKSSNSTTIIAAVVAFISGVAATMIFKG